MSKSALSFLTLTLICGATAFVLPAPMSWAMAAKLGTGIFGLLFLGSLFIGRRIKFDPVLR